MITRTLRIVFLVFALGGLSGTAVHASGGGSQKNMRLPVAEQVPVTNQLRATPRVVMQGADDCPLHSVKFKQLRDLGLIDTRTKKCTCPSSVSSFALRATTNQDDDDDDVVEEFESESEEVEVTSNVTNAPRVVASRPESPKVQPKPLVVEEEEEADSGITAFEDAVRAGVVKNLTVDARRGDNILDINCCDNNGNPRAVDVIGAVSLNAVDSDLTINHLRDSVFQASTERSRLRGDGREAAMIRLHAAKGRTITFNLDRNLTFQGKTLDGRVIDLLLVLTGQGRVVFNLADGKTLKFTGGVDETAGVTLPADGSSAQIKVDNIKNNAGGTKVLITMEQTKEDFDNGVDKVVFQRKNFAKEENRALVFVGPNSLITFVSDDPSGVKHETKPAVGGFASVGFDVSNKGTGRMVLFVRGAYNFKAGDGEDTAFHINKVFPFNDGAVVVAGHKVDDYTVEGIVGGLNYSVPAGGQARLRVIDDKAYASRINESAYNPQQQDRRGLLVINDAQSVSSRASDPYLGFFQECGGSQNAVDEEEAAGADDVDEMLFRHPRFKTPVKRSSRRSVSHLRQMVVDEPDSRLSAQWAYSAGLSRDLNTRNVRTGFVLGVNGVVDVNHATFFDYVAGSVNRADWLVQGDQRDAEGGINSLLMAKNPSAFVADGLDALLFYNSCSAFKAANPLTQANPRHAQMVLRGDGQALFRSAASASLGYVRDFWKGNETLLRKLVRSADLDGDDEQDLDEEVSQALDESSQSFTESLIVATTKFDGVKLADSIDAKEQGQNVLEVEGLLTIKSLSNMTTKDSATGQSRRYAMAVDRAGRVVMPTLQVDHTGSEQVSRPLIPDDMYARYGSPRLFLNNHVTLDGVQLLHSDVTKIVTGDPVDSVPALVGGERMRFAQSLVAFDGSDRDRWRFPELRLRNAEIALVESLAVAGVRVVVSDDATGQDNRSALRFVDQDRGLGSVFMLGSQVSTTLDNTTSDWMTQSAYVNVFRNHVTPGATAGVVELALTGGVLDQANVGSGRIDTTVFGNDQHHVVIASLDQGAANITAGSSETVGQSGSRGYPYQNTRYADQLIAEPSAREADPAKQFSLDATKLATAGVVIKRNNVIFESFDDHGNGPIVPVRRWDASGVINVGHGGHFEVAEQGKAGAASAVFNTNVVTRVTSEGSGQKRSIGLNGQAILPASAASFGDGFGVQMFGSEDAKDGLVFLGAAYADQGSQSGILHLGSVEIDLAPHFDHPAVQGDGSARMMRAARARASRQVKSGRDGKVAPVIMSAVPGAQHHEPIKPPRTAAAVGAGQEVRQLIVYGATPAQPCELVITGGATQEGGGRVHEFITGRRTNEHSSDMVMGEGAHARIYLSNHGSAGLGAVALHTENAWRTLGATAVQLSPLGDGVVQVNADLLVVDPYALLATTAFGQNEANRLTFTSSTPVEIRIPSGVELDLSSFGRSQYQQQVVIGGKVRLVFEKGSGLRFPSADKVTGAGVVLYATDDAQIVFEGDKHTQQASGLKSRDVTIADRVKIYGKGQIWLNRQATMVVENQALVGVQADSSTPQTDVVLSVQGQAQVQVGTLSQPGGSFEVGNPAHVDGTVVNFSLNLQGQDAGFTVGRNSFVGLGAGIVYKSNGAPNGQAVASQNPVMNRGVVRTLAGSPHFTPDSVNAWRVQPLYNVNNMVVDLQAGVLSHQIIADGSDAHSSLFAIGQAGSYDLRVRGSGQVRGGGNMMFVPAGAGAMPVNVWDFAGELPSGERYAVMSVTPAITTQSSAMSPAAFFDALAVENFKTQSVKALPAQSSGDKGGITVAFVHSDDGSKYAPGQLRIIREQNVRLQGGRSAASAQVTRGAVVGLDSTERGPFVFGSLG